MVIHEAAAIGYGSAAATYERARPTYAAAAFEAVAAALEGPRESSRALDVGAGTGKWTRGLIEIVGDVTAVEPVAAMRVELARAVPSARVVAAAAESLPLVSASADLVSAAASVHWFDLDHAVPELCRVARPGGVIAVAANVRDTSTPWVAALDRLLAPHRSGVPSARTSPWREVFGVAAPLELIGEQQFANPESLDVERLTARVASLSYVASMSAAGRDALLEEVRAFAADLPQPLAMPYTTVVALYRRRPNLTI